MSRWQFQGKELDGWDLIYGYLWMGFIYVSMFVRDGDFFDVFETCFFFK